MNWTKVGLKAPGSTRQSWPKSCRLNWTKVGLKVKPLAGDVQYSSVSLNWTKVGLKDTHNQDRIETRKFELD